MSIEKTWKDIDEQSDEALAALLKPQVLERLQSKDPLATIKKNMLINSIWAMLIAIGYLLIIFLSGKQGSLLVFCSCLPVGLLT
jgi:hypothetical protein